MALYSLENGILRFITSPAGSAAKVAEISRMETGTIRTMAAMYNIKLSPLDEDQLPLRVCLMNIFRLRVPQVSQLSTQALKLLCKMWNLTPPQSVLCAKTTLINYIETHRHQADACLWEEHQRLFPFVSKIIEDVRHNDKSNIEDASGLGPVAYSEEATKKKQSCPNRCKKSKATMVIFFDSKIRVNYVLFASKHSIDCA
jgi:hypothetical protein